MVEHKEILTAAGSLILLLLGIIGWFIRREIKTSVDNKLSLDEAIEQMKSDVGTISLAVSKLNDLSEQMKEVTLKIDAIDRDGRKIQHDVELLSQMIKPLFDMKDDFAKSKSDIALLFSKLDHIKEELHRLERDLIIAKTKSL